MLERLWGKGKTPALLMGVQVCIIPLDVGVAISQKIRKQSSSRSSNNTFGYISNGCSNIFTAVLFVMVKAENNLNTP